MKIIVLMSILAILGCSKRVIKIELIESVKPPVVVDTLPLIVDTVVKTKVPIKIENPAKKSTIVYFEKNSFSLSSDESAKLIDYIKAEAPKRLYLVGGCCWIGSNEYNLELGYKRAQTVQEYILSECDSKVDFVVQSVGENAPVSETNISLNRRCEVVPR